MRRNIAISILGLSLLSWHPVSAQQQPRPASVPSGTSKADAESCRAAIKERLTMLFRRDPAVRSTFGPATAGQAKLLDALVASILAEARLDEAIGLKDPDSARQVRAAEEEVLGRMLKAVDAGTVRIDGDQATVTFTLVAPSSPTGSRQVENRLRRHDGRWVANPPENLDSDLPPEKLDELVKQLSDRVAATDAATRSVLDDGEPRPMIRHMLIEKFVFVNKAMEEVKAREAQREAGEEPKPPVKERKTRPVPPPELAPGEITRVGVPGRAVALAVSPDGKSAFCGSTHTADSVHRWHLESGDRLATYQDPTVEFHAMALDFTTRGNLLVAGGTDYDRDAIALAVKGGAEDPYTEEARGSCDLRVWDVSSGTLKRRIEGSGDQVLSVDISPDGKLVAAGTAGGEAHIWTLADGKLVKTLRPSKDGWVVNGVRFSPDGARLAVGSNREASAVCYFSTRDWSEMSKVAGQTSIGAAAFSRDGTLLASTRIGGIVLNRTDGKPGTTLLSVGEAGRGSRPNSVSFSADGRRLLSAEGVDSSMPDLVLLVVDTTPRIRVFDVAAGRQIAELSGHVDAVGAAHFTPDGSRIVSCGTDGTLRVWKSPPPTAEPPAAKPPTAP